MNEKFSYSQLLKDYDSLLFTEIDSSCYWSSNSNTNDGTDYDKLSPLQCTYNHKISNETNTGRKSYLYNKGLPRSIALHFTIIHTLMGKSGLMKEVHDGSSFNHHFTDVNIFKILPKTTISTRQCPSQLKRFIVVHVDAKHSYEFNLNVIHIDKNSSFIYKSNIIFNRSSYIVFDSNNCTDENQIHFTIANTRDTIMYLNILFVNEINI